MEKLLALLAKLGEGIGEDVKTEFKSLFQELNKDRGKALTDLEAYKKGDSSYRELVKKLKEAGIPEGEWDKVSETLGVKKSLQDEIEIYKITLKDREGKLSESEKKVKRMVAETTLGKKLDEAVTDFKTPEGKQAKIISKFLEKHREDLFKQDLDLTSEVIVGDAIKKVVDKAYAEQTAFFKEAGINPEAILVHKVTPGDGKTGSVGVDVTQVRTVLKDGRGSLDAAARAMALELESRQAA